MAGDVAQRGPHRRLHHEDLGAEVGSKFRKGWAGGMAGGTHSVEQVEQLLREPSLKGKPFEPELVVWKGMA